MKKMTKNLHSKLFHGRSPFALATAACWVVWIGSEVCILGDLTWVIGEMTYNPVHWYHYIVATLLTLAFVLVSVSGIWLYLAIDKYLRRLARKNKNKKKLMV